MTKNSTRAAAAKAATLTPARYNDWLVAPLVALGGLALLVGFYRFAILAP